MDFPYLITTECLMPKGEGAGYAREERLRTTLHLTTIMRTALSADYYVLPVTKRWASSEIAPTDSDVLQITWKILPRWDTLVGEDSLLAVLG